MKKEYMTETLLGEFLAERFAYPVTSPTLIFNGKRYKPDFLIEDLKLIIEFDGPRHYTQPNTCVRDILRTEIFMKNGYRVISIPYFIQLDAQAIAILFAKEQKEMKSHAGFNNYPHGFISNSVIMPAEYCSLGLLRFNMEINGRLRFFKNAIIQSMDNKIETGVPKLHVYPLNTLALDFELVDMYPMVCQMRGGKEAMEHKYGLTDETMKTHQLISV